MFDVDRAVRRYSRAVSTHWFPRGVQIEELEDHLLCEIEQFVADGLAPEAAFKEATTKLGEANALREEFRKSKRRYSLLLASNWSECRSVVYNRLSSPHAMIAGILLTVVVSLAVILQETSATKWTVYVFDVCCAVSVKIIGLFG